MIIAINQNLQENTKGQDLGQVTVTLIEKDLKDMMVILKVDFLLKTILLLKIIKAKHKNIKTF